MKKEEYAQKIRQYFLDNPDDADVLNKMIVDFNKPNAFFSWYDEFDWFRDLIDDLDLPFYFIEYNPREGGDHEIDVYTWQECGKDEKARAIRWASDVYIDLTSYEDFVKQLAQWSEEIANNF